VPTKRKSIKEQIASLKTSIAKRDTLSKSEVKEIKSLAINKLSSIKNFPITDSSLVEVENLDTIPFAEIEQAPIYPGCEDAENKKRCFSNKITMLVNKKFNVQLPKTLGLTPGRKRIFALFTIDKKGEIVDIKARAPHKKLEEEAIRVINLIPKVIPGKQKNKIVAIKYGLPIIFNVQK